MALKVGHISTSTTRARGRGCTLGVNVSVRVTTGGTEVDSALRTPPEDHVMLQKYTKKKIAPQFPHLRAKTHDRAKSMKIENLGTK